METPQITALGFLLTGLVLMIYRFRGLRKQKRIMANGIERPGVVFDLVYDGDSRYYAIIQFSTNEEVWITEKYDSRIYELYAYVNQPVNVIYNSNNPKEFLVTTDNFGLPGGNDYLSFLVGVGLFAIGGIAIIIDFLKFNHVLR